MGSKTQTSTSQQATTPTNLAGLQSIFGQVQNAAQTPYTPYSGELTAPVNAQQQSGIAGVNANANAAQPYFGTASNYATQGASPITAAAIQGYSNPFTQSVIDATQNQFNESNGQQQQQVKGSAAMAGALGGDRQAVAQAETARQQQLAQAPVIAGLNQQNYQQALAAAQADRGAAANAAGQFSGLGTAAQQAALQGAGAQINAGTLEQSTQQQADQAQYQQYLQRQAFPYQNAQFLAQYGTPAALAQGSSTSGTQTAPGPSIFAQLAGLGIAGAGVATKFAADGGRIEFADGGSPFNFINDTRGYVPVGGAAPQATLQAPQLKYATPQKMDMSPITSALSGVGKGTFRNPFASSGSGGWGATDTGAEGAGSLGGLYAHGGLVDAIHSIHRVIKHSRGGSVGGSPFQGYASGGPVKFASGGSLDDRFGAVQEAIADGSFDPVGKNSTTFDTAPAPFRLDRSAAVAPDDAPSIVPPQAPASPMRAALPPQITGAPQDDSEPGSALAFDSTARSPMALAPPDTATEPPQGKSPFFSPKGSDALIATGLGIMASRSPFALSALGEGGLHGLKSYSDATAAEREAADKKITQGQNQKRIDFEAQRIAQSASQFAKTQGLAERRQKLAEDKTPEGYRATKDGSGYEPIPGGPADPATIRKTTEAKGTKLVPAGSIVGEDGTLRPAIMEQSTGKIIDAVSGKPVSESDKIVTKGTKAPVSDEDAKALASYYVKTGDRSRLNGLGISGEARQKVQHYVKQVQDEQKVTDEELGTRVAEWEGRKAGQRTLGVQEAKMGSAAIEAEGAIKQARGIIERLPRTAFLPMNQLIQGYSNKTLNPDQVELYGRAQAIVNTYAAVMARGANITTDSARGHAEALLNTAGNPATFNRMMDTMLQEIDMAKHSPAKMREFYRKQYGEKSVAEGGEGPAASTPAAPAAAAPANAKPATVTQNGHVYNLQPDGSYK